MCNTVLQDLRAYPALLHHPTTRRTSVCNADLFFCFSVVCILRYRLMRSVGSGLEAARWLSWSQRGRRWWLQRGRQPERAKFDPAVPRDSVQRFRHSEFVRRSPAASTLKTKCYTCKRYTKMLAICRIKSRYFRTYEYIQLIKYI